MRNLLHLRAMIGPEGLRRRPHGYVFRLLATAAAARYINTGGAAAAALEAAGSL